MKEYDFRNLHPDIFFGTASDRYAGWIGQIYSPERYEARITRRKNKVGGKTFVEEVLPVECVEEFFDHFRVLEIDFTFYRPLLDKEGQPTQNFRVLQAYAHHLKDSNKIILKAPQAVFAQKIRKGGQYIENSDYLNSELFTRQFYEPALKILGERIGGFVLEQEYQRKQERVLPEKLAQALDTFFKGIPQDPRYHAEFRTEAYLTAPVFEVFERHGVGQVLSHWTWLPSLKQQFTLSENRILNGNREIVLRLLTPRGMRYKDAYAKAHPFNELKEEMLSQQMIEQTLEIMNIGINQKARVNVIVNNRAGGNAPQISLRIARQFTTLEKPGKRNRKDTLK